MKAPRLSLGVCLLLSGILLFSLQSASAQVAVNVSKPVAGLHISARIGISYYGGDLDAANADVDLTRRAIAAELLWHFSPHFGLMVGYQQGEYPRIVDPLELRSALVALRVVPTSGWLSPYFQVGFHSTYGGLKKATGPMAGIGLNLAITSKLYLFQEAGVNFVFPDDAVDGLTGGSNFDLLGFVGGGLRLANLGVRYPKGVKIEKVYYPEKIEAGAHIDFRVSLNEKASRPILVAWEFQDGAKILGNPIVHRFLEAGEHTITVTAENSGGADQKKLTLYVAPIEGMPAVADTPDPMPEPVTATTPPPPAMPEPETAPMPEPEASTMPEPVPTPTTGPDLSQLDITEAKAEASLAISQAELAIAHAELALAQAKEAISLAREASASIDRVKHTQDMQPEPMPEPVTTTRPEPAPQVTPEPEPLPEPAPPVITTSSDAALLNNVTRLNRGYAWVVSSEEDQVDAERAVNRYLQAGYQSEVMAANVNGKMYYRVTVGQYATRREANAARQTKLPPDTPSDAWLLRFNR